MINILRKGVLFKSLAACALVAAVGCTKKAGETTSGIQTQFVKPLADATAVIEFEGGKVTAGDIKPMVQPRIEEMDEELSEIYRQMSERMLVQKLLEAEMKKQGAASIDELFAKAVPPAQVDDAAVAKFLKDNDLEKGFKDPKTGKRTPVKKEDVKRFLVQQEGQGKQQAFVQGLLAKSNYKVVLPEKIVQVPLNPASPVLGNASAKVVIHLFSDFECPFCEQAHALAGQVNQAYGDKVAFYFRHMPLTEKHPQAMPAAIAGQCLNRQGKFWAFHDKAFAIYTALNDDAFKKIAQEIGADMAKFESCYANKETASEVTADVEAARKSGVNGTPTIYINGKRARVAPKIDAFKRLIDAELAKK